MAFTPDERACIVAEWSAPGRYQIDAPPETALTGPWVVRLTPEASQWFWTYGRAVGAGKAAPTQTTPSELSEETAAWEAWVQARLAYDRWLARRAAEAANSAMRILGLGDAPAADLPPPLPGPIPEGLLAAVGNPPPLAAAVAPLRHTVRFEGGEEIVYVDQVAAAPRYAYFRFPQGVINVGTPLRRLPTAELDALFAGAGMTASEQRIAKAVSRLEGGFESVNTYDTGFVSVGFIQFASMEQGTGSLAAVLLREKTENPAAFQEDFRCHGIDVGDAGGLVVVDLATGAELSGAAAVRKIIDDKRLIAVFQRAGMHSKAFRTAQIQVAKARYWPADDPVRVTIGEQTLTGKVSDVVKSEAGLATLFDRKVNRGNIAPFAEVLTSVMTARCLAAIPDAAPHEREIIAALKYRADFLADPTLSQPPPIPDSRPNSTDSALE
jgi:hypothetical protein